MKKLWILGGTMGVGKTAAARELWKKLPAAVFFDGDWAWDAHPFVVTDETRAMAEHNIAFILQSFLDCTAYENVIFCWVLHEQGIWDDLLKRLKLSNTEVCPVALVCTPDALAQRLGRDVDAGIRKPDIISRSIVRLPLYDLLSVPKLDVSTLTPAEAADKIMQNISF